MHIAHPSIGRSQSPFIIAEMSGNHNQSLDRALAIVDAAAAAAIRQALLDLATKGAAILVVSQDLDELLEISDRFGALNEGRLSALKPVADLNMEEIGLMMGGAHDMEVAHVDA